MLKTREGWALVPLRLLTGCGFLAHGFAKLARGPDHFGDVLAAMGIPAPNVMAWVTTLVEIVGGACLVLGAFVMVMSIPLAIIMFTAMFGVHLPYGFSSVRLKAITATGAEFGPVGYELNLLYVTALAALALGGTTRVSFDRWRWSRRLPPH